MIQLHASLCHRIPTHTHSAPPYWNLRIRLRTRPSRRLRLCGLYRLNTRRACVLRLHHQPDPHIRHQARDRRTHLTPEILHTHLRRPLTHLLLLPHLLLLRLLLLDVLLLLVMLLLLSHQLLALRLATDD